MVALSSGCTRPGPYGQARGTARRRTPMVPRLAPTRVAACTGRAVGARAAGLEKQMATDKARHEAGRRVETSPPEECPDMKFVCPRRPGVTNTHRCKNCGDLSRVCVCLSCFCPGLLPQPPWPGGPLFPVPWRLKARRPSEARCRNASS
jgi:hypothetical protein